MKLRFHFPTVAIALASVAILSPVFAKDKKKKDDEDGKNQQQLTPQRQWLLWQKLHPATPAPNNNRRPQPQPQPQPDPINPQDEYVQVQVFNRSGVPLEAIRFLPDGTSNVMGEIQPAGPDDGPAALRTRPGMKWVFATGGQALKRYTVTTAPQQQLIIAGGGGPAPPPNPDRAGGNAGGNGGVVNAQAQAFLQVHNAARSEVGVAPLRWSAEVAAYAQQWANRLAATGTFEHRPPPRIYGENIYAAQGKNLTPADAARNWLSERAAFVRGEGGAGHYTQMVWRQTTEVGYGIAKGADGTVYIVGNYSPPGNMMGEPPY